MANFGEQRKLDVLSVLDLKPSEESVDYVNEKTQFQLHHLLTEQRHPKTWELSRWAAKDLEKAVKAVLSVDEDIAAKLDKIATEKSLRAAAEGMKAAMKEGKRIYFYGCGATGRLAKQMESSFWRPFWERVADTWPEYARMKHFCVGEMTGGDRALISSLEGLEDLQLVGKTQLEDHGIEKGDFVMCITEGGETSSVIGTILAARQMYEDAEEAAKRLFFVFNNPENVLRVLDRSVSVLDNKGITKIPLWTGPQVSNEITRRIHFVMVFPLRPSLDRRECRPRRARPSWRGS